MSRPLYDPNVVTEQRGNQRRTGTLYLRGPGKWVFPDIINGFANPGDPYGDAAYRMGIHSCLEFDGFLDVSAAVSGTVAFVLLEAYWQTKTFDLLTSVRNSSTFSAAMITVDRDNGEATVTWPIT